MAANEEDAVAIGNANILNGEQPPAVEFGTLVARLQAPATSVQEQLTIMETIARDWCDNQAIVVEVGLIPVLNSLLSRSPADWLFELLRGSEGVNFTPLCQPRRLVKLIDQIQWLAMCTVWAMIEEDIPFIFAEIVDGGLLLTLSNVQENQGISRRTRVRAMRVVSGFLHRPGLALPNAELAIGFLVRYLQHYDVMDQFRDDDYHYIDDYLCTCDALTLLKVMANHDGPEYFQESMNAGVVATLVGLMKRLIDEAHEDLMERTIDCTQTLLNCSHYNDQHSQAFAYTGIADIALRLLPDVGNASLPAVAQWIVFFLEEEEEDAFMKASFVDCLPRLLMHEDRTVQNLGIRIAGAHTSTSVDNPFMVKLLNNGSVEGLLELASGQDLVGRSRFEVVDVLANLCVSGSDEFGREMVSNGYHRLLIDFAVEVLQENYDEGGQLCIQASARLFDLMTEDSPTEVAEKFCRSFFDPMENGNARSLAPLFRPASIMSYEGVRYVGPQAITEKLAERGYGIRHEIINLEVHANSESSLFISVDGLAGSIPFVQTFVLTCTQSDTARNFQVDNTFLKILRF